MRRCRYYDRCFRRAYKVPAGVGRRRCFRSRRDCARHSRPYTLEFDHLAEDREYFRYSLQHCDARWQPSGLVDSEFLDGFNEGRIEDYDYSRATTVHYVHYSLTIPNEEVAPTISGNYLLTVYKEDDPESPVLQCRFMVSEQTAPVQAFVTSRTDVDYNAAHQQLEICVDTERAGVEDIYNDLRVVVGQNGRLDSERALMHPLRTSGRKAYFEHVPELIFEAGNEYRRFETVSEYYPGLGVESIDFRIHTGTSICMWTSSGRKAPMFTIRPSTDVSS